MDSGAYKRVSLHRCNAIETAVKSLKSRSCMDGENMPKATRLTTKNLRARVGYSPRSCLLGRTPNHKEYCHHSGSKSELDGWISLMITALAVEHGQMKQSSYAHGFAAGENSQEQSYCIPESHTIRLTGRLCPLAQ